MKIIFPFILSAGLFIALTTEAQSQRNAEIEIQGSVSERETSQPIGFVHVRHKGMHGSVTDQDGSFVMKVQPGDTLYMSHLAYEDKKIVIPADYTLPTYFVKLKLTPREFILENVDVVDFMPIEIEDFKDLILQSQLDIDLWSENFNRNDALLQNKLSGRYFMNVEMSDYENFRRFMEGPQGVDILGFIDLITQRKNLKNKSFGLLSRN